MKVTVTKNKLLDLFKESLMFNVKRASSAALLKFSPQNVYFASDYLRDLVGIGKYLPTYFTSYDCRTEEKVVVTESLLNACKSISDDVISFETTEENVILRGERDSYDEPKSTADEENYTMSESLHGLIPSNMPFKVHLEIPPQQFKSMPESTHYYMRYTDKKFFITAQIGGIAPFTREVKPIVEVLPSFNAEVGLDSVGFSYVFTSSLPRIFLHFLESSVCTSQFDETHFLTYVSSTVRVTR